MATRSAPFTASSKPARSGRSGCSNFSAAQLREARDATAEDHAQFASVQNDYSLLNRDAEGEVLPECERLEMAFIPYFPLANGLLTGKYRKGQPLPEGSRLKTAGPFFEKWLSDTNLDRVEALIRFAESKGHTILELAMSWLLARHSSRVGYHRGHVSRPGASQCACGPLAVD